MRNLIPVFLLSAAIISFQLVLIQIISITQWYHFAYMIISIALLGFGAAGTTLSLYKNWFLRNYQRVIYFAIITCGIGLLIAVPLSQWKIVRFDSYLLFAESPQVWRLLITYLVYFLPFYAGALALGVYFFRYAENIGSIYFANLAGSAIGGVIIPVVMWWFSPDLLPALVGILVLASCFFVVPAQKLKWYFPIVILAMLVVLSIVKPPQLHISQFKGLSSVLDMPKAEVEYEDNSPYGQLKVISSPALRDGHGVSLQYRGEIPVQKVIFNNGNWVDAVLPKQEEDTSNLLNYTPKAFAYSLLNPSDALLLQGGAFNEILLAQDHDVASITAIEPNPQMAEMMLKAFKEERGAMLSNPNVNVIHKAPRTFLLSSKQSYDVISLPNLGSFGGSSGLNAIEEDYLFTKEAFVNIWQRLDSNGIAEVTVWVDFPLRQALKLGATIRESLASQNIESPSQHVAAVKSWGTISFLVKKRPYSDREMEKLNAFCDSLGFEPMFLREGYPEQDLIQAKDSVSKEQLLNAVFSDNANKLYNEYAFRIQPATDQKPFFHQFLKWESLKVLKDSFNMHSLPFFEIGYLMVWITFIQILVIATLLIIVPLVLKKTGAQKLNWWLLVYFGCIGLGYMFIEIYLLQQSILYFGNPVYAAAAAIGVMLLFAGLGSYYSEYKNVQLSQIKYVFIAIAVLIILYILFFGPMLKATIHFSLFIKIILFCVCLIPLSFMLGFPFPSAIKYLSQHYEHSIPWAWAINGFFSVISTVLATIISIEFGYQWVLILASVTYFIPALIVRLLKESSST